MELNASGILAMVQTVATEKGIDSELLFEAVEQALGEARRRDLESQDTPRAEVRVRIDRATGDWSSFRVWLVVADDPDERAPRAPRVDPLAPLQPDGEAETAPEEEEDPRELDPACEKTLSEARELQAELAVGQWHEEELPPHTFGRIAAQIAKQIIVRRVRDAERIVVRKQYQNRVGELLSGHVSRVTRDNFIVTLTGNAEALLPRSRAVRDDGFRVGDTVRAVLEELEPDARGPQLILGRRSPAMLEQLFRLEVPEIQEGLIEIRGVVREPGSRAKVAVKTNDGRIDPVGVCVGMRGTRVLAVSHEVKDERIDIVPWHDDVAQFVISALSPAEVDSVVLEPDRHTVEVGVPEENIKTALGHRGENVRLASALVGWHIDIVSTEEMAERKQSEHSRLRERFVRYLEVDAELAGLLVQSGFVNIESIAYVPLEELVLIDGIDQVLAENLRERAKNAIFLMMAQGEEEEPPPPVPTEALLSVERMTPGIASRLAAEGITTVQALADQSVPELLEIGGIEERMARRLIMEARRQCFEEPQPSTEAADSASAQPAGPVPGH